MLPAPCRLYIHVLHMHYMGNAIKCNRDNKYIRKEYNTWYSAMKTPSPSVFLLFFSFCFLVWLAGSHLRFFWTLRASYLLHRLRQPWTRNTITNWAIQAWSTHRRKTHAGLLQFCNVSTSLTTLVNANNKHKYERMYWSTYTCTFQNWHRVQQTLTAKRLSTTAKYILSML